MPQLNFAAATLPPHSRLNIAIKSLVKLEPVSHIAKRENVSRNFVYDQKYKAESALNQAFLPTEQDKDVLFYLPVTRAWITQLVWVRLFSAKIFWLSRCHFEFIILRYRNIIALVLLTVVKDPIVLKITASAKGA